VSYIFPYIFPYRIYNTECVRVYIYLAHFLFPNTTVCLLLFSCSSNTNPLSYQLSIFVSILTGDIFATDSIELVNDSDGVVVDIKPSDDSSTDIRLQLAGNRKLRFEPVGDSSYFLHGQCTATSGILEPQSETIKPLSREHFMDRIAVPQPVITSQSCKLNLCLGGGGFSCIAIYSGSAFVFNFGKGIALNNGLSLDTDTDEIPLTFEAPPLPPPFPGTIIGGKD